MTATIPWRDDAATMTCPVCGEVFTPEGRQRYCSTGCRQIAWRRRRQPLPVPPPPRGRTKDHTVYECPECESRYLGEQRCNDCGVFCRRLGPGGHCPNCDEPVVIEELVAEVTPLA